MLLTVNPPRVLHQDAVAAAGDASLSRGKNPFYPAVTALRRSADPGPRLHPLSLTRRPETGSERALGCGTLAEALDKLLPRLPARQSTPSRAPLSARRNAHPPPRPQHPVQPMSSTPNSHTWKPFGPSTSSRQVRSVPFAQADRRLSRGPVASPLAEAIRGFDSGFGVDFVVGPFARFAAVWSKSCVFSSLPIRKVLVLPFR